MSNRRAFLTPPPQNSSDIGAILLSGINLNAPILSLIDGALYNLMLEWKWEQIDENNMTPEDTAMYFSKMKEEFIVSLCDSVATCLNDPNSSARQAMMNAIAQGANSSPTMPVFTGNNSGLGLEKDRTLAGGNCENDICFGFCDQLVTLLNDSIVDMFEIIEVGSNIAEKTGILVDNIPFLSQFVDFADQIAEETTENYNGYYTDVLHNKFACELFCMMIGNPDCTLMFSEMANYFYGLAGFSPTNVAISVALETLSNGMVAGASTVYALHGLLCASLQYGSEFLGIDIGLLQKTVKAYMNDPNSDWETLCDPCAEACPEFVFNFETVECWLIDTEFYQGQNALYVSGEGFYGIPNGSGTAVKIYWEIPASHGVSITYHAKSQTNQDCYTGIIYSVGEDDFDHGLENIPAGTRVERSYTIPEVTGITKVAIYCFGGNNGNQYYTIDSATIAYTED